MTLSIHDQDLDEMAQVASLLDLATGWYEPWYFRVRLEEEMDRVRRYSQLASVIHIKLPPSASHVGDEVWTVREQLACLKLLAVVPNDLNVVTLLDWMSPEEVARKLSRRRPPWKEPLPGGGSIPFPPSIHEPFEDVIALYRIDRSRLQRTDLQDANKQR